MRAAELGTHLIDIGVGAVELATQIGDTVLELGRCRFSPPGAGGRRPQLGAPLGDFVAPLLQFGRSDLRRLARLTLERLDA